MYLQVRTVTFIFIKFLKAIFVLQVYLCHKRNLLPSELPSNVTQKPGIQKVLPKSVILDNNEEILVDTLLFCTGYNYYFPFLASECHVTVNKKRITPLYKHILHARFTTLAFIGIPNVICPFPLFDRQVQFVCAALDGRMALPSQAEMENNISDDYQERLERGLDQRHAHHLSNRQWAYNDDLAHLAKFKPLPPVTERLYEYVHDQRTNTLQTYKQRRFKLTGENSFEEISI